jgi:hypothetical protein
MAVAYRNSSSTIAGSGANANPGTPSGATTGDVYIGVLIVTGSAATPALPTGWTSLYAVTSTNGTTASGFKMVVGYVVHTGSAPSTTFTNANLYREAYVFAFSGVDTTTPIDAQSASGSLYFATTKPDPPAVTVVTADAMIIAGGAHWQGASGTIWGAPTNYTMRSNTAVGNDIVVATRLLVGGTGSQDPGAFTTGTLSTNDAWNGFSVALRPASSGSIITKTQTAIARIATNPTKTQPSVARIAKSVTKTQPSIARLSNTITKTQPAISRIANTKTLTQPAISRIAVVVTKTQPSVARVANTLTKTQGATANIVQASALTKTQTAIARIATNSTKTQPSTARIANNNTKTQPAVSRVANTLTKTQGAISRIATTRTATQPAIARISTIRTLTQPSTARVAKTLTKTQGATANIIQSGVST